MFGNLLGKFLLLILLLCVFISCTERWKEHQLRQIPNFRPEYKTIIRKDLLNQANYMKNVLSKSYQFTYQFTYGDCYPKKIATLEDLDMYSTIFNACNLLDSIQTEAKFVCNSLNNSNDVDKLNRYDCEISSEIILQLSDVINYLEEAEPIFYSVEKIN